MALLGWLRCYRQIGNTAQKSIDEAAKVQQIVQRTDEVRSLWCGVGGVVEVGPIGGDQRFAAVGQDEHELQAGRHARLAQDLQRLSLEWVMRARDSDAFRKVLMMGSVWWLPSTKSGTIIWRSSYGIA
jgi:hypothetical protein